MFYLVEGKALVNAPGHESQHLPSNTPPFLIILLIALLIAF